MSGFFYLIPLTYLLWHISSLEAWLPVRPNIILIMTDDQDIELGSMQFMPKTIHLLKERGVTFHSGFVSTPICCPSRSSILTGMYAHNHHVLTNNHNCSGNDWRNNYEKNTFAVYLKNKAGYTTGYFGKYLNEYTGSYIPPGWDHWMGLIRNSRFYNYTVNVNGDKIRHGSDYGKDYFTDLIANDTIAFIRQLHGEDPFKPYLIVISFPAPHGPEDPAPQYSTWFQDVETHRTKAWNYAPNPDKQWLLQHTGRMEPVHVIFTDVLHRRRLQTLQSVDINVQRLVNELRDLGDLSNTFFIYTSDHGYHLGQFGLVKGKNMPYEFDIRVPYFIRGPGLPKNISIREPVMNVDIAPTILDIAGVAIPRHMDGRSLVQLMRQYDKQKKKTKKEAKKTNDFKWRDTVLIERGKMTKLTRIRDRFMEQRGRLSKDARVQRACTRPEFREPCRKGQQWKCIRDVSGKWKIFKCQANVDIVRDCDCSSETMLKRRYRRSKRQHERISIRRVATIAQMDEEGESVFLEENLQKFWEEEFLQYIQEKEMLESGEWYQGILENRGDLVVDDARIRRSVKVDKGRIGSLCIRYNMSVICKPKVFRDSKSWTIHKAKVNDRIENLKRKLMLYKDMRRTLKRRRPSALNSFSSLNDLMVIKTFEVKIKQALNILRDESNHDNVLWSEKGRKGMLSHQQAKINPKSVNHDELHANCTVPQMNCFVHGADHWRTPPFWPELYGQFCFCQNSNNNTYWCLRTLHNIVWSIPLGVLEQLSKQLELLRTCQGHRQCEHYSSSIWHLPLMEFDSSGTTQPFADKLQGFQKL
uniref:Sulfatase N-terminal domain-containing protein n=1 Tax=Setaria digitata TaxID=48799 RepID=A0A915PHV8_9BILA